jgi:hypothetical protein
MSNNNTKITAFFDSVSRTIIGEVMTDASNENVLVVKDPAVLHLQPNPQTGQLALQILPLFFKEFLADRTDSVIVEFDKKSITQIKDPILDFKIVAQYQQIVNLASQPGQPQPGQPQEGAPSNEEVVKLFDDEE